MVHGTACEIKKRIIRTYCLGINKGGASSIGKKPFLKISTNDEYL